MPCWTPWTRSSPEFLVSSKSGPISWCPENHLFPSNLGREECMASFEDCALASASAASDRPDWAARRDE